MVKRPNVRKSRRREVVKLVETGRKLEGKVSSEIRAGLDRLGILNYKMSDRFRAGIPDIYFEGGSWIETKIIPRLPTKIVTPMRYFSGPQKIELNRLTAAGDQCFAGLYFSFNAYSHAFALVPWWEFERIALWDLDTITSLGTVVDSHTKPDYKLERYFNKAHPLRFDPDIWWDEAFKAWVRRNPDKFDPEKPEGKLARYMVTREFDPEG